MRGVPTEGSRHSWLRARLEEITSAIFRLGAKRVLAVIVLQVVAYMAVIGTMSYGFIRFRPHEILKYQLITASNALLAPLVLLIAVVLIRSRLVVVVLHVVQALGLVTVSLYYGYFQALPHVAMLRQASVLPAVSRQIAVQLVGAREIVVVVALLLSCAFSLGLTTRARQWPRPRGLVAVLLVGVCLFVLKDAALNTRLPISKYRYDGVYFLKRYGFLPVFGAQLLEELAQQRKRAPWPGLVFPQCATTSFPRSTSDVILIQVESLDPWVVDWAVEGRRVMPFLSDLAASSLRFENFFALHRGGGSSDAEIGILTGLLPLGSHTGFLTADFSRVFALPTLFNARGYYSCALHANSRSFFYRGPAYRRLGFNDFFDRESFTGDAAGWYSKDAAFFAQVLEILDRSPRPVFAYVITMQSHGPFENHGPNHGRFQFPEHMPQLARDYVLTMNEVDSGLRTLVSGLRDRGRLDHTLIAMFADHQSGAWPDRTAAPLGDPVGRDRIPLIIHYPAAGKGQSFKVGSHLDIGPTVLALLGERIEGLSFGEPLIDAGQGRAVLSVDGTMVVVRNAAPGSHDVTVNRELGALRQVLDYSQSVLYP